MVLFPAPVAPTMPTRFAGLDLERHVLQHVVRRRCRRTDTCSNPSMCPAAPAGLSIGVTGAGRPLHGRALAISLKTRSEAAMAACRMLNFSDMSLMGLEESRGVLEKRHERAQRQRVRRSRALPRTR